MDAGQGARVRAARDTAGAVGKGIAGQPAEAAHRAAVTYNEADHVEHVQVPSLLPS
jgi:hypothetical protein